MEYIRSIMQSALENIGVTISIAALIISCCTLVIARSQMRISSAKAKLDLYNKRFSIYVSALDYYQALWADMTEDNLIEVSSKSSAFVKAYRESQFLFDEKSKIYETLAVIMNSGSSMAFYFKRKVESDSGAVDYRDDLQVLHGNYLKAQDNFEKNLSVLEDKLKKYLDFTSVNGWKFF
jgi:hypothetical protein